MFKTMAGIVLDESVIDSLVRPAIFKEIPPDVLREALAEAEELIRPADYNYLDYVERRYTYVRTFFPRFLKTLDLAALPSGKPVLNAVATLKYWNSEGIRIPKTAPTDFVPVKWKECVCPKEGEISRHYYELCVMDELHRGLRAAEIWAIGGRRYGNVEDLLIAPDKWAEIRAEFYEEVGLPRDPKEWLSSILPSLRKQIVRTVSNLEKNPQVFVDEGLVHLRPIEAEPLPDRVGALKEKIAASWKEIRIQDLLVEVDSWVGFTHLFWTLRGRRVASAEINHRGLLAALIAKGCNIGTEKMASLTPTITYGSLRRIDEIYLYDDALQRAFQLLQRAQNSLPIAGWLGREDVSMSDGMRLATRVGTLRQAIMPHAFAPGERAITYYYHVSHQGPAFGAQVIGHDRNAAYVLDGIFHIQSELPIHEHYTDTHGSTENIFALAYPFGIEFAPRIKLVHHQDLHYPPGMQVDGPFKGHFAGPIDVELIEQHWDDYVRILASIRRGVTSVVLLTLRLSSYAKQNPLYRALREIGRIYKTRFIMRFYDESEFRRRINAGLNRMEHFNYLARHLFYARHGENWEREFDQQLNRASALLILANACVLWNSVQLTHAVKALRDQGLKIDPEDMRHVSPYAFEHIIPYGIYLFRNRGKEDQAVYAKAQQL